MGRERVGVGSAGGRGLGTARGTVVLRSLSSVVTSTEEAPPAEMVRREEEKVKFKEEELDTVTDADGNSRPPTST